MSNGSGPGRHLLVAAFVGILLLAPAPAALAATATAAETAPTDDEPPADDEELDLLPEVVVYGTSGRLIAGLRAESELDAVALASYGANTVGDLIGQVAADVDNGTEEGPVILINGRPANGITSVNQLPAEVVQSFQVLPPQAAAALGYAPTRRVINVVLRQSFSQETANVTVRGATAGRGLSTNANLGTIRLQGNNFRDLSLRVSKTEPLLEAHRDIISQQTPTPYDLVGNVVSWPLAGSDIDPALSAMAGAPVTVAGVPSGLTAPALSDFVPLANLANVSDMGRYRTLVADQYNFGIGGNLNMQLPKNMSLSMYGSIDRSHSVSQTGATSALLHVPASSPYTPFSQDVGIARYLGSPLRQRSDPLNAQLFATLNRQQGQWRLMATGNFNWRENKTLSERRIDTAALQAAIDAGTVNPFDPLSSALLGDVLTDHATSRGHNASLQLQASRTVLSLPAGPATFSGRAEVRHSASRSKTVGTQNVSSPLSRREELAFASLQVPLIGPRAQQGLSNLPPGVTPPPGMAMPGAAPNPWAFGMGAELSGSARDVGAVGTLFDFGYGLNWRLGNRINVRMSVNHQKVAPQPEALTNPIVIIDDFRTYDFVRQETVLVRYITGGNPDLDVERRRRVTIGGTARPFSKFDLNLNAEYQRTIGHDQISQLPAVSEDVQLAFPDRYLRDTDGRLIQVDARLISYERSETEQIRWGGNFRRAFAVPPVTAAPAGQVIRISDGSGIDELAGAGWRLNSNFTHTWVLASKRLARAGLPEQNLLSGGVGTGNSQPRHTVLGRVGLAHNGTGLQLNVNWRSGTHITAGIASDPNDIRFSPLLRLDINAFVNLGTVFPGTGTTLLKDSRVTLAVENLLDAKQRVRDQSGTTPLRYQPYLLNALGRTVSLSLRKLF